MNTRRFTIGLAMVLACAANLANAQTTYTWDIVPGTVGPGDGTITGGTGAWNTTNGNWTTDAGVNNVAWVNAGAAPFNNAIFGAVAGVSTVTLAEPINVRTLTINSVTSANRYTIQGSTLNFSSGGNITWNSTNISNFLDVSSINSAITGAPAVTGSSPTNGNTRFVFAPSSGSQTLGKLGGVSIYRLAGSTTGNSFTGTVSPTSADTKIFVSSGASWTLTGVSSGYENQIAGTLIIGPGGTLRNVSRDTTLTSTGILHWNNAGAIQDVTISTSRDRDFNITGGSIDQTSGAAITSSTWNPQMRWGGNWTFIGSNGANSNLNMGTGQVFLNGNRQVTVTNAAATLTVGGVIANIDATARSLTKAGAGTLELRGANTYNGTTTVSAGTLRIAGTGSINSTSSIILSGGRLDYNSSVAMTAPLTFTSGTLGGTTWTGSSLNNLTIGTNRTISPGNSPGTATTVDQTWAGGGNYTWEINNATGTVGADPGWDLLSGTGNLTITANSGTPFNILITSLTLSNISGNATNFDDTLSYEWRIADFANPVIGFDASDFVVNTSGFTNPFTGNFGIALGGTGSVPGDNTQVYITYVAVPEPAAIAILGSAVGLLGLRVARRRKA